MKKEHYRTSERRKVVERRYAAKRYAAYVTVREEAKAKLLAAQDYRCAVCLNSLLLEKADLDHDHACCGKKTAHLCGKCYRGALCRNCNLLLGFAEDSVDRLRQAISYLDAYRGGDS